MPAHIEALGDAALCITLGERIEAATLARVRWLTQALRATAPVTVRDIVPAYASVAVYLDTDALAMQPAAMTQALAWCEDVLRGETPEDERAGRLVEIPVTYGGPDGPDLAHVAAHAGLSESEVVARHAAVEYRVAMLGFAPGFPYLAGLDPALATPRHATPRQRVPAGSIGIGGLQTGLYPRESPGGWQLIGRTARVMFDPARDPPSLLLPGDRVRFVPA